MPTQSNRYPSLIKSYKKLYPFKIGTTSFIYPDLYVPNVEMLGPYMDEIELLLFESDSVKTLITPQVLEDLMRLSQDLQVSYNIHLPTDRSISDPDKDIQNRTVDMLAYLIEQLAALRPTSYTLHIPPPEELNSDDQLRSWLYVVYQNLKKMAGLGLPAHLIAIETLDYPFDLIADIIDELNYRICMDVGHLMLSGYDIERFFQRFEKKVSIIHLHGVLDGRDHLSLANLPAELLESFLKLLQKFKGTVSIEVFAFNILVSSMNSLEQCWQSAQIGTDSSD